MYPNALTDSETQRIEEIHAVAEHSLVLYAPDITERRVQIDTERSGAYILIQYECDLSNRGMVSIGKQAIDTILNVDSCVQDVVVSFSVQQNAYLVTIDVARPTIRASDAHPLIPEIKLSPVIPVGADTVASQWKMRQNATSNAQCSLALCVGTHLTHRFHELTHVQKSTSPKLGGSPIAGSDHIKIYGRHCHTTGEYAVNRQTFETLSAISKYISDVTVIVELDKQGRSVVHWLTLALNIANVPDSERSWKPYYTPPRTSALKHQPSSVDSSRLSATSKRRAHLASKRNV